MSRVCTYSFIESMLIVAAVSLICSTPVLAIISEGEFLSHTRGERSCSTQDCHNAINQEGPVLHAPLQEGKCTACHKADAYPNAFGLERKTAQVCAGCHEKMFRTIQSSLFVHGPVKEGDCYSCHEAHASEQPMLLKQSYSRLCSTCHKTEALYTGEYVHKPVKDGNCGLCHDPHASNYRSRLVDTGANLCIPCHEDFMTGMTEKYVHAPLLKSGCADCHDPHSGKDTFRLKTEAEELCFTCHKEKKNEVSHYTQKHDPAFKGQCIECHSPHYSVNKSLLLERVDKLCYKCHRESTKWEYRKFKHGPVVQGNCVACHNPHGSDNAFILKLAFPHKFYAAYEKGKYSLCFLCHKESLITTDVTTTITNFRNGDENLHSLHVRKTKGRTCRACHDIHASDQEGRIRDEFPFGGVMMPLEFIKTASGGTCVSGCHRERTYDRTSKVLYH